MEVVFMHMYVHKYANYGRNIVQTYNFTLEFMICSNIRYVLDRIKHLSTRVTWH